MLQAVTFERNCGATTDFSTQISVLSSGRSPSGSGNAFRADTNHNEAERESWGGPWASARWLGNERLEISYDAQARTFATEPSVGSVQITYRRVQR
jgi:hypothetical protein